MIGENENSDEILIKIPRSAWDKGSTQVKPPSKERVDAFELFSRTGVRVISGKRNSEHGATQIQTLAIDKEQKPKILGLLDNPALYTYLPKLLNYLYLLGCGEDAEMRFFAAMAVVNLADYFPFVDLKDAVISPWARDRQGSVNRLAALTLVQLLQKATYKSDVLNLLKHWISNANLDQIHTALTAYFAVSNEYSKEALEAIKLLLVKQTMLDIVILEEVGVIQQVRTLLEWFYLHEPTRVVNTLYDWLSASSNEAFLLFTASTFLSVIEIKDVAEDNLTRSHAVEIVYRLWEDTRMPLHLNLQEMTTEAVADWAKTALRMRDDNNDKKVCQQFFHELYAKCATTRKNRLELHLQRWQELENRRYVRLTSRPKDKMIQMYDYLSLIPSDSSSNGVN